MRCGYAAAVHELSAPVVAWTLGGPSYCWRTASTLPPLSDLQKGGGGGKFTWGTILDGECAVNENQSSLPAG